MQPLHALIINCTLKPWPKKSETQALIDKVVAKYKQLGVTTECIRFVDHEIKPGVHSDMGNGDEWPQILEQMKRCNICIIATPIWMGRAASPVQRIFERLDAIFSEKDLSDSETGQFFPYNKVAGALITGNEDGAHHVASHILWAMQEFGFTIPPNVNSYWVGVAGGSKNYTDGGGERLEYTNKNNLYLVHNTVYMAQLLRDNPISTNIKKLNEAAKQESD